MCGRVATECIRVPDRCGAARTWTSVVQDQTLAVLAGAVGVSRRDRRVLERTVQVLDYAIQVPDGALGCRGGRVPLSRRAPEWRG